MIAYLVGSILIAIILKPDVAMALQGFNVTNITLNEFDYEQYCGLNNCPSHSLPPASNKPSVLSVYIFCGALIGLCILAIIITVVFVDNVELIQDEKIKQKKPKLTCAAFGNFNL